MCPLCMQTDVAIAHYHDDDAVIAPEASTQEPSRETDSAEE
jgi:hypothetical protein